MTLIALLCWLTPKAPTLLDHFAVITYCPEVITPQYDTTSCADCHSIPVANSVWITYQLNEKSPENPNRTENIFAPVKCE
jgi:hypothetical protein